MTQKDLQRVRRWRNHPKVRLASFHQHEIQEMEHGAWFEAKSQNPLSCLLVYEEEEPVGFVAFYTEDPLWRTAEWSFYTNPEALKGTGSRMARLALRHAFLHLGIETLLAKVLYSNPDSLRYHQKLGFEKTVMPPTARHPQEGLPFHSLRLSRHGWEQGQKSLPQGEPP